MTPSARSCNILKQTSSLLIIYMTTGLKKTTSWTLYKEEEIVQKKLSASVRWTACGKRNVA
jgi:hypothetical protein